MEEFMLGYGTILLSVFFLLLIFMIKWIVDTRFMRKRFFENMETKNGKEGETETSSDIVQEENQTIPKKIIQTWKTHHLNKNMLTLQKGLTTKNPGYEYLFFTDEDIEAFLKNEYPEYYITYQRLPIIIQKIDFFRYIAVYHFGGFYFDLDMECLEPLDDSLLQYKNVIPMDDSFEQSKKDLNRQWLDYRSKKILLGQYAFGAVKSSEFMKHLVDNIHYNIDLIVQEYETKVKNNVSNFEYFVYSTTGPDYVTYIYKNYQHKAEVFVLDYKLRQHFGRYARHRYFGSWKNNTNN
jgi:mannosyltransferase OCH1-like enzyme